MRVSRSRFAAARATLASALTCALCVVGNGAAQVDGQRTVVHTAQLVDLAAGALAGDRYIVVEGDRIVSVTDRRPSLAGADLIELGQLAVLPGLIDAHVHLAIGGQPRDNAQAALRAGFTTLVDLGAQSTRLLQVRDSINTGAVPGPHVFAAGIWVGTKNGVCEFNGVGLSGGPEAFRARVRENLAAGADLIKVCVTGWPAAVHANPSDVEITADALDAVVQEAHAAGKLVVAHAIGLAGVQAALRAGVDGLAHTAYLDAATAAQMRTKHMFMISTLASLTANDTSAVARDLIGSLRLALRSGVPLAFGTDGGVLGHGDKITELKALIDAGLTPAQALRSATVDAARLLHLERVGGIAAGMSADVIAVEGNPLQDIGTLGRVRFVMARGRVVVRP